MKYRAQERGASLFALLEVNKSTNHPDSPFPPGRCPPTAWPTALTGTGKMMQGGRAREGDGCQDLCHAHPGIACFPPASLPPSLLQFSSFSPSLCAPPLPVERTSYRPSSPPSLLQKPLRPTTGSPKYLVAPEPLTCLLSLLFTDVVNHLLSLLEYVLTWHRAADFQKDHP